MIVFRIEKLRENSIVNHKITDRRPKPKTEYFNAMNNDSVCVI